MINQVIHGDCFDVLKNIPDGSIDAVITDPPYKYLNHKLESDWDEKAFFTHCFRVLKKDGMLCFFGAKESYFRWNVIAMDLGLNFKEQIIWDKVRVSNPISNLHRYHENISIFTKGKGTIKKVRIDKLEYDNISNPKVVIDNMRRIISMLNKINTLEDFLLFKQGKYGKGNVTKTKSEITMSAGIYNFNRGSKAYKSLVEGRIFPSIFRCLNDHYDYQHPTQKPPLLISKLVEMLTDEGGTVLDPFAGSGTTAVACKELGRNYICIEKELEYYQIACNRINQPVEQGTDEPIETFVETSPMQLNLF
ncbi:MAG: DNA-methyltransferase [Microcystis panniformis]